MLRWWPCDWPQEQQNQDGAKDDRLRWARGQDGLAI
jgi:hypothetical protein